jgi:glycosyltransferase involved in cell wall biosynthesis
MQNTTNTPRNKSIIVYGINSFLVGGAQRQLVRQLRYFDTTKYEFHLITLFQYTEHRELYDILPEHVVVHKQDFRGVLDVVSWFKLLQLLRTIRPNLVVSSLFFSNTVFRILKLVCGYTIVSREHNTYTEKRMAHKLVDRMLAHLNPVIVAVSDEVAAFTSAQEKIPLDKFLVIENGIDLTEIQEKRGALSPRELKRRFNIDAAAHVALYVGRLVVQKNLGLMIEGFADFARTHKDWKLLLVGEGACRGELETMIKERNLDDTVYLVGEIENVHPYYAASDCCLSVSNIEGMSNVHLEALAHGVPVLSTKTGGTSRLIVEGETGLSIPEYTADAVSSTLRAFVQRDLEYMKRCAREKGEAYAIAKTVKAYESLFDAL